MSSTNARQFYLTRLIDWLNTCTDDHIQKQTDAKRAELMVKLELDVQKYKSELYAERDIVRNFIANPKAHHVCHHLQPFRFDSTYDPYHGRTNSYAYRVHCTQCNESLGYCETNGDRTHIHDISYYGYKYTIPSEILHIVHPISSLTLNLKHKPSTL